MKNFHWPEVPLKLVCDSIVDCVNKTAPIVEYETPYKMIRTTNVKNGVINLEGARYVKKETFDKWTRRGAPKLHDVVLTREAPLGDVGMITTPNEHIFLGQRLMQYRADPKKLDPFFLLYSMQSSEIIGQLKAAGSGSTVEHIRVGDAENIKIKLPPIQIQKDIGSLLKNYDVLIENNNRRIAILERMAKSLYREWFVKYRYPSHENQKLVDSPIGLIPEGWELKSASEVININPRTSLKADCENPFISMSCLSESSMVIDGIESKKGNSGAKFINRDTLFSRITPCLQNGKIGFVQFLNRERPVGFGSTEFIVFRETEKLSAEFIYLLSRTNSFRENAIQSMTGASGRQRVQNECFSSFHLSVPPADVMRDFTAIVAPMFNSIHNLSERNRNLRQQRDMLLPKLISGSIEI